ncbi:antibiotic biosynthesis monooxygenase [Nocardia terpenica]|uniref:antibiotic biosynthesis monooxygenase family protein n=1 Tax=Nocardia terpenica TaxID=455432 RepID=UPI001896342B|nr:antibiotic biosynthesis monooxygenase family protein [Nocardia terpenica]MBF6064297.1 antibiotic biosynthesis monooxygenase [Nocardia terpenica]MBF6106630.1 antibiotic biosynthesis monooxygenase [Nocardia terpenica]MBF6113915.1 antibiotic biosynthesis monooxygenase [Nocardia terpenica]MBF6120461.1 antibiotic biosynthesis monooxygenase [Nocardia terpenica]MBF6154882.1 antibiotic biosynthesis monooxygenase [Nocardia terpenica]
MSTETTIVTDAPIATLINVFTVRPDRQRALVDLLAEATEQVIRHSPGFISANFHVSTDGVRVVNYAQWESPEAMQAMLDDPAARAHIQEASALADSVEPHVYTVASVHHR